ncbi:helix-turn-helix domain-containing protein [Microbacterium sp.]|uniref:helix-turn-helix domain-containing protein n=1 Tax=Microbacterium sp. TaxID=51671 RepID=UPI00333EE248
MDEIKDHPRAVGTSRDVSLSGDAARMWLRDLGWRALPPDGTLRVFGDRFSDTVLSLSRIWLTGGRLQPVPHYGDLRVVLVVDGEAELDSRGWRIDVGPWDLLLLDAAVPTRITARSGFGFMQFIAENERLVEYHPRPEVPIRITDPASAQVLATMVSATLAIGLSPGEHGTPFIARAFENIVAAIIARATSTDAADAAWSSPSELSRALAVIAAHHTDPDFDVTRLAALLHLSRRHVVRVLARIGTTPSAAIRHARLTTAAALVEDDPRAHSDRSAQAAGFRDLRALRRAMRLAGGESPDPRR